MPQGLLEARRHIAVLLSTSLLLSSLLLLLQGIAAPSENAVTPDYATASGASAKARHSHQYHPFPLFPSPTTHSACAPPINMSASTATANRPMESRTGRTNQRYNEKGERLVAGLVPLTKDKKHVLLIQSTRRKGWVLPKGGWETDEDCETAAQREAWEEAGILVQIDYDLGDIVETRPPKAPSKTKTRERALYRFYEATVTSQENDWPEKDKRLRQWMTFATAYDALNERPELQEALIRSTMER